MALQYKNMKEKFIHHNLLDRQDHISKLAYNVFSYIGQEALSIAPHLSEVT